MTAVAIVKERPAETDSKKTTINLRVPTAMRELIDSAAAIVCKTRTEFMLESARQHAIDVLLDQKLFQLDAAQHQAFLDALSHPPKANTALKRLFARNAPWEK